MDGNIGAESTLGEGSLFWFEIPVDLQSARGSQTAFDFSGNEPRRAYVEDDLNATQDLLVTTRQAIKALDRPIHILVVEDNRVNQTVAVRTPKKMGVGSDAASDGEEAIQRIENTTYDLVLMDVQMPKMDGLETTRFIREKEAKEERGRARPSI